MSELIARAHAALNASANGPGRPEHGVLANGVPANLSDILSALRSRGIGVTREKRIARGTCLELSDCPFIPGETHRSSAALYSWADGNIGFRCLGGRCTTADHRILDLCELLNVHLTQPQRPPHTPSPAAPGVAPVAPGGLNWSRASSVKLEKVETVWDGRLVRDGLNLIVGDEGIGKGLLYSWLVSQATTGRLTGKPVTVGISSTEEHPAAVIAPRLKAAGADLDRVQILPLGSVGLPEAIPGLVQGCRELDIRWLVLDPVNEAFSEGYDPQRPKEVAHVLGELAKAAEAERLTILGLLHTNRGGGVNPRDRYAHSLQFRRSARATVIIGRTPDDGEDDRTIASDKANYVRKPPALRAQIRTTPVDIDGNPVEVPHLVVLGEADAAVEDLFIKDADKDTALFKAKTDRGKMAACATLIKEKWERMGKPRTADSTAFDLGHYDRQTIKRARARLGVESKQRSEGAGRITNTWAFTKLL